MLHALINQLKTRRRSGPSGGWWQPCLHQDVYRPTLDVLSENWHLGFTAFGGPPVHFKIFNDKFVKKAKWIDEQMYQELFSVSQALSGPASTKMLYCINLIHGGTYHAILSFLLWSLPVAIAMYGLSIGISSFGETLPAPAYALLSGLNAAVVGIIALAAVELSRKSITDALTRLVVLFTATAGLLYNALWYFPVLMVACSLVTLIYDFRWLHRLIGLVMRRSRMAPAAPDFEDTENSAVTASTIGTTHTGRPQSTFSQSEAEVQSMPESEARVIPQESRLSISWKTGASMIALFLICFVAVMILRGVLKTPPLIFSLFTNMLLAGTIIFGGGPVVVPLLREYVVTQGWVSPRDFLIGLALIQSFPGPNFNFAVFLGSLTAIRGGSSSAVGAIVAWIGIFLPGLAFAHGVMGIWSSIRNRRWVRSILRGINAGAVGLIYTAVYRIWQTGYIGPSFQSGRSLGDDPWWLVISAVGYFLGSWHHLKPPFIIIGGAILGLIRYAVVRS